MEDIQGKCTRSRKTWLEVVMNEYDGTGLYAITEVSLEHHSYRWKISG